MHIIQKQLCNINYVQLIKCNNLLQMEGQNFKNKMVSICLENLNLVKIG
jgi:hypothetical protein